MTDSTLVNEHDANQHNADNYDAITEYNAFGPWITRVESPAEVPPLFASHGAEVANALLTLKFPRAESRRDLEPGMNLYDHLLQLTQHGLTVFERRGTEVERTEVRFEDLTTISSGAALLDGWLTLQFLDGRAHSIPYNGSSSDVITRLVDTIWERVREVSNGAVRWRPSLAREVRMPLGMDDLGSRDAGFTAEANDLVRDDGSLRILCAEGRRVIHSQGGRRDRWREVFAPTVLHGSVIAATGAELVVLSRVEWMSRSKSPDLSMKRTVVLLDHVSSVTARAVDDYPEATVVTVQSGRSSFDILLPTGSPGIATLTHP